MRTQNYRLFFGQFSGALKCEKTQKMALKWPQKAKKG